MECTSQSESIHEPVNASSAVSHCQPTLFLNLVTIIVILLENTISIFKG